MYMTYKILKDILLTTIAYLLFVKITNIRLNLIKKTIIGLSFVIFTSAILFMVQNIFEEPYQTAFIIGISSILLTIILKEKFVISLTSFTISYAISYILFTLTLLISSLILYQFRITGDSIYIFILSCIINIAVISLLSKVKSNITLTRKKGVGVIGLIISGIVFIFYSLFREDISYKSIYLMVAGFSLAGYGIYYWWKRETAIAHNDKINELINKKLQTIVNEKEKDNELLTKAHDYLASVVHKDNKKLDAIQRVMETLIMQSQQADVITDAQRILTEIKAFREQASAELSRNINNGRTLPLTGLPLVDAKFEILLEEATNRSIDFDLELKGDITDIDSMIQQLDLVNIIGDLVQNSFIAIKHLKHHEKYRSVLFTIGKDNDVFELSVEDSGIQFNINTLVTLGIRRITTHADEGGSGYGYETIFEKLNHYRASLTITEYKPMPFTYSKRIAISFDGRGSHTLKTFRNEIISKQNSNKNFTILALYQSETV